MCSYTLKVFSTGTIAMSIPFDYKTNINGEFQHLKSIAEIRLSDNIMAFLNNAHSLLELNSALNPRGPYKRSLIHYMAMGNYPKLLHYLLSTSAAKDNHD